MFQKIPRKIWMATVAVMVFGLIALYSATMQNARVSHKIFYDQLIWAVIGCMIIYFLSRWNYRIFYDWAYLIYAANILLLILVLVSGRLALGARRWLELGPLSFQPSEITKITVILFLARYYCQRDRGYSFRFFDPLQKIFHDLLLPLVIVGISMLLIFKQPDLGTAIIVFGIFFFMLFIAGVDYRYIFGFLGVCLAIVPFAWHILKPYQKDRLLVFMNPNIDPLGAGYTIVQSRVAVGSGQLLGKGWLAGTQNQLNFLPERHTDFIFSVIGEEWGLVGALFLLFCYFVIISYGVKVAEQTKDHFGQFVAMGIVSIFSLQVIINIGMTTGVFPVVGITLPLVSYGRTSFIVFCLLIGILLNIAKKRAVF